MASNSVAQAIAQAIIAARYDEVARALEAGPAQLSLGEAELDEAIRLTGRCRRLSADRQRLQHVADDLESDERAARDQLVGLLGGQAADGSDQTHLTATTGPDPTTALWPTGTPRLALWVLGPFRLAIDGQIIIGGDDDRSSPVLRYLACTQGVGVHKEQLADRFWPEATTQAARRNLHQSIYTIRRLLGCHDAEDELVFANDHYRLGRGEVWRDIDELARHVEQGRRLRSAGEDHLALSHFRQADLLYGGELLAGHPYDEWAYSMREHHRSLHREAAAALLDLHASASEHLSVIQVARRLLDLDPADEDACRRLMTAHAACGQQHLAVMAFVNLAEYLRENHGLEPSPETVRSAEPLMGSNRLC